MKSNKFNKFEDIDIASHPAFQPNNIIQKCNITVINDRAGNNEVICRCPLCGDSKNPTHGHLSINIFKNTYHCLKCGEKGYLLGLYSKIKGISNKEAFKELLEDNISENKVISIKPVKVIEQPIASIDRRNNVYNAFLDLLPLYKKHIINLQNRGLSIQQIKSFKIKSMVTEEKQKEQICYKLIKQGYKLKSIPGFYKNENNNWTFHSKQGYLIPSRDINRKIEGMQMRVDNASKNKYRWFSSKCFPQGTRINACINIAGCLNNKKPVVIVEGILKSSVCYALKHSATYLGVPGVNALGNLIDILKSKNIKEVFLAYDMDKIKNEYVAKAEKKLIDELKQNSIKPKIFNWDIRKGKGLDDFLLTFSKQYSNENYMSR